MTTCFFASDSTLRAYHRACQGRLQWHHVIEKQRLKREFPMGAVVDEWARCIFPVKRYMDTADEGLTLISLDAILGDERNRVWLCARHHELVSNHRIYIPRSAMESVEEFAAEYGISALVDKQLGRAAA